MTLFELEAILKLDAGQFNAGVNNAKRESRTFAQTIGADADSIKGAFSDAFSFSVGQLMADAVQAAMAQLVEFTKDSITAASDLEQTNQKIGAIFGDMSSAVMAWSATTKSEFGIGQLAAKTYVAQLAGILSTDAYGFDAAQIYEYSTAMVELAGDLASFHNMDVDTIWGKILSGLRGETEAIEDLGLDMRVASLAAFAGVEETAFSKLPTVEQWLYRYQYILQNTTVAQGDFARTSDSYANQMALFEQNIKDLQATIGEGLLPVMTDLVSWFNSMFASGEDAGAGIDAVWNAASQSYTSIETTTTQALALVTALEELQAAGQSGADSNAWNTVLSQLKNTLPELATLIETESGRITGGTYALKAFIVQWKTTSMELARQQTVQGMYDEYAVIQAELAQLQTEQIIADQLRAGAQSEMDSMGASFLSYMVSGMEAMGASAEDIAAMQIFGAEGAESLLARIANGGSIASVMGGILQGGDIWKNNSFETYFEAGGGSDELLKSWAMLYSGYRETAEKYDIDNSTEIAERQALLAAQEQEIALLQEVLAQLVANGQANVEVTVNNSIDGTEVSSVFETQVQQNAADKALTSN